MFQCDCAGPGRVECPRRPVFRLVVLSVLVMGHIFTGSSVQSNLPEGSVVHGEVRICFGAGRSPLELCSGNGAILEWDRFVIVTGKTASSRQPCRNADVFNRVAGDWPDPIHGALRASRNVFVINPKRKLAGSGGSIDGVGLALSARDVGNAELPAGGPHDLKGGSPPSGQGPSAVRERQG